MTSADNRCHRVPCVSHIGADTVRTRKPANASHGHRHQAPARPRHAATKSPTTMQSRASAVAITAAGARAFVLNYRRKPTAASAASPSAAYPDWSTAAAREEAKRLKREIDGGADPVGEHRGEPGGADRCRSLRPLRRDYVPRKRPSTQRVYRQQIAADILPALGRMKVAAVAHADIDAFHHELSARAPTHANRTLAVLSKMFSLAMRWGRRSRQPVQGHRAQSGEQAAPLSVRRRAGAADRGAGRLTRQGAANAVRLLLLTGARRGELLAAKWADIDLEAGVWSKPGATTKQRPSTGCRCRRRRAGCSPRCARRRAMTPNGFSPPVAADIAAHINAAWDALRKAADIPDVAPARSQAHLCERAGVGGAVAADHRRVARAYHADDDASLRTLVRRSAARGDRARGAIITGAAPAEVLPLKGKRR